MSNNEKLAEALGLDMSQYELVIPRYGGPDKRTGKYDWKLLGQWLASPAGEKAVRDKVRELCETVEYEYVRSRNIHRVWPFLEWTERILSFNADTEAEAYAAALLWMGEADANK